MKQTDENWEERKKALDNAAIFSMGSTTNPLSPFDQLPDSQKTASNGNMLAKRKAYVSPKNKWLRRIGVGILIAFLIYLVVLLVITQIPMYF